MSADTCRCGRPREIPKVRPPYAMCMTFRCPNPVVGALVPPCLHMIPGGWSCQSCADRCIKEYAEKLGETWVIAYRSEAR